MEKIDLWDLQMTHAVPPPENRAYIEEVSADTQAQSTTPKVVEPDETSPPPLSPKTEIDAHVVHPGWIGRRGKIFLAICLGILGLGAGGAAAVLARQLDWKWPTIVTLAASSVATIASAVALAQLYRHSPITSAEIARFSSVEQILTLPPERLRTLNAETLPEFLSCQGMLAIMKKVQGNLLPAQIAALPPSVQELFRIGTTYYDRAFTAAHSRIDSWQAQIQKIQPAADYTQYITLLKEIFIGLDELILVGNNVEREINLPENQIILQDHQGQKFSMLASAFYHFPRHYNLSALYHRAKELRTNITPPEYMEGQAEQPLAQPSYKYWDLHPIQLLTMRADAYATLLTHPGFDFFSPAQEPFLPQSIRELVYAEPWFSLPEILRLWPALKSKNRQRIQHVVNELRPQLEALRDRTAPSDLYTITDHLGGQARLDVKWAQNRPGFLAKGEIYKALNQLLGPKT